MTPLPEAVDAEGWAFGAVMDGTRGWYPPTFVTMSRKVKSNWDQHPRTPHREVAVVADPAADPPLAATWPPRDRNRIGMPVPSAPTRADHESWAAARLYISTQPWRSTATRASTLAASSSKYLPRSWTQRGMHVHRRKCFSRMQD